MTDCVAKLGRGWCLCSISFSYQPSQWYCDWRITWLSAPSSYTSCHSNNFLSDILSPVTVLAFYSYSARSISVSVVIGIDFNFDDNDLDIFIALTSEFLQCVNYVLKPFLFISRVKIIKKDYWCWTITILTIIPRIMISIEYFGERRCACVGMYVCKLCMCVSVCMCVWLCVRGVGLYISIEFLH